MKGDAHELSERKKLILKAIVDAHIEGGEPVGSKYILESRQLTCSSATIRNEMAELEEMGYLEQPHTSAGRVPSELGYRFYVDSLIDSYAMTTREIMQINNLLKIKMGELDQILDTASKLASSLTNYTGIAIRPKATAVSFARFEAVYIDTHNFLLIMMNGTAQVKTKNIRSDAALDPDTVSALGKTLNQNLAGLTASEITLPIMMQMENDMAGRAELVSVAVKGIYEVMSELDGGELKLSGLNRLLQYPEYADSEQLGELIGALESKDEILDLVEGSEPNSGDGVKVVIGSESSVKVMNQSAIVYKQIKKDGRTIGAVGIIGPLRMDYAKVLATIDSLGGNIANLLDGNDAKQIGDGKAGSES
ncbi:MAG: heat-inducible transcription repressor HrcA [Clostridia bacterium]|nr:heat-inducible transcription repressor HrcA [Clostridia bacterium]